MNNPSLARHVKSLELREPDPEDLKTIDFVYDPSNYSHWSDLGPSLEAYFTDCNALDYAEGSNHGKPAPRDLVSTQLARLNERYSWDLLTANLIIMLHNLEDLSVIRFVDETREILSVLQIASKMQNYPNNELADSSFKLPALRRIYLGSWDDDDDQRLQINDIIPLLGMGSVTTFRCEGISEGEMIENIFFVSRLTSLTLEKCGLRGNDLERIIENYHHLQELQLGYDWCDHDWEFEPSSLFHALLFSQDQLTSLIIVDEVDSWGFEGNHPRTGVEPIPCLAEFTKLRVLVVSSQFLLDKQILVSARDNKRAGEERVQSNFTIATKPFTLNDLPASLAHFTVQNARPNIVDMLTTCHFNSLPNLKAINVHFAEDQEGKKEQTCRLDGLDAILRVNWRGSSEMFISLVGS